MARALAVISPTVSPRMRMAVSAAPTWAGVGSPRRQAAKKLSAQTFQRVILVLLAASVVSLINDTLTGASS